MDIISKIDIMISDMTIVGDVATNTAKGKVDVVGGSCPKGRKYSKKKKVCVPVKSESSIVGGSYLGGTTVNIIGSQQTRAGYMTKRAIIDLQRKEPIEDPVSDPTKNNINRRKDLKFNKIMGAYVPDIWGE